jgi:hypothetical protein
MEMLPSEKNKDPSEDIYLIYAAAAEKKQKCMEQASH